MHANIWTVKTFFSGTGGLISMKAGMKHRGLKVKVTFTFMNMTLAKGNLSGGRSIKTFCLLGFVIRKM